MSDDWDKKKRQYRVLYRIKSFSDPTKEYVVGQKKDGKWICTCPAYIYHRGRKYELPDGQKVCKHIYHVALNPNQYVPFWDAEHVEMEEMLKYSVNYIKDELLDARITAIKGGKLPVKNEEKEEDIPLFAEDYARLNIKVPRINEEKPRKKKSSGLEL